MNFRVYAKHIFLTYPQSSDIDHKELHDHLETLADNVYSCKEAHADGGWHFHAICTWESRKDVRRSDFFDYSGRHPNIQAVRDLTSSVRYIAKDGSTIGEPPGNVRSSRTAAITLLLAQSQNPDEFIKGFEEIDPVRAIINHQQIEQFANKRFRKPDFYTPRRRDDFTVPAALDRWVSENLFPSPERPKCLILISPTRFGKTEWARCLGEHTYWNNYVTDTRNPNARYAVIDDMERFDSFTGAKAIFGCQKVIGLNPKYSRLQQWNWGIPTIWLFNFRPNSIGDYSYYAQNSTIIELTTPLF